MTDLPTVSVIVVSHGRPALLRRALIGIGQLFYRPFELIVVADPEGLAAIADLPFFGRIKTAVQSTPNISVARNLGADLAAGAILAFIDDDAVPEPTWLGHLIFPLFETDFAASTGTVLGRNGISVQWANRVVDALGQAYPMAGAQLPEGCAIKLEGTNMAVRRDALVQLGGFDEGFGFYLDETDLSRRLNAAGSGVALAPLATVHHGYAASTRRSADRVPLGLYQIGFSTMLFLHKHAGSARVDDGLNAMRSEQSARLTRLVTAGKLDGAEAGRLMEQLEAGINAGRAAPTERHRHIGKAPPFCPLHKAPAPEPALLVGRWFRGRVLTKQAESMAQQGRSVSLFLLDHTIRAHRVQVTAAGVWCQSGGLFGPSVRSQPRFTCWSFSGRIRAETERLAKIRWISGLPAGHIKTLS